MAQPAALFGSSPYGPAGRSSATGSHFGATNYNNNNDIMLEYGEAKKKVRMAFEEIQTTGEYMETHYYKQRTYAETRGKVAYSSFWFDYAQFLLQRSSLGGK